MSAVSKFNLPKHWPKQLQSWIGGKFVPSKSGETYPVFSSALGTKLTDYQVAGKDEVALAIETAKEAQKEWAKWTPTDRGRVMKKAADILHERNFEMSKLEAYDTSRPIQETDYVDIVCAKDAYEYYGGLAPTIGGQFVHQPNQSFAYTVREPLGVTAGIGAFNYPIQSAAWKSAPALACGNAMVFKPAEDTPLNALALGEVLKDAGIPDGLYNVVLGPGSTGQLLSGSSDISKISFTGSKATGIAICKDAANTLKKVQMELGGKSPLIIFPDCDLNEAVSGAMMANWYSNGEVCSNGTRVFVHSSIKKEFMEQLVERTKKLKIGDPLDPESQVGAMITEKHMNKVLDYIKSGKEEGANLVYGGERVKMDGDLANGAFLTPAIFDNCTDDMRIVKEEIFGMVMSVLEFETEEEVVQRANDTEFGLSAGVFTKDIQRAHRVIHNLQAGTTWINNYNLAPADLPWSGHKHSGIGVSNGTFGIDEWTQVKSIYVEMDKIDCPYE